MTGLEQTFPLSPSLSPDGLTLYYAAGGYPSHLYFATRAALGDTVFSAGTAISGLNSSYGEVTPRLGADGLELFYALIPDSSLLPRDIMVARRDDLSQPFSSSMAIVAVNTSSYKENTPWQRADGLELLYTSTESGNEDIWRATRVSTSDEYGSLAPVTELNTTSGDASPSLSLDGLTVHFGSNRTGGSGGRDLWYAERPTTDGTFGTPTNLAELNAAFNSSDTESDPALSLDGTELFFVSDRSGSMLIYRSERACTLFDQ